MRVNSSMAMAETVDVVEEALRDLSKKVSPISATGGWFPTMMIATLAKVSERTALERLTEMLDRNEIEQRRRTGDAENKNTGYFWRLL